MSRTPRLTVDDSGTRFLLDGTATFLLADTLWAAFGRMSTSEWVDSLRLRRRQGFNAVNISVLPIAHDQSHSSDARTPFLPGADGSWDLDRLDPDYFARARTLVELAWSHGLVPVLVVLWCNYVPNTWGALRTPELVLSADQSERYVDLVLESFADLSPVFCISGDDAMNDEVSIGRYTEVLHRVRTAAPDCLTTMHTTPTAVLPGDLAADPDLSYYAYQSGHDDGWDTLATDLPERYVALPERRPVVSMEPCYEGHGFGSGRARHGAFDVRRASWTGVLAGAGAGLGYAAHGAWSWHRAGEAFNGEHFSGTPLPAQIALQLPGAWDVGLLRQLVEEHSLWDLRLRGDVLGDNVSEAVVGMSEHGDTAAVYLPYAFPLRLAVDGAPWQVECWDLARGRRDFVPWTHAEGVMHFEQPDFIGDAVYLLHRPSPTQVGQ